MTHPTPSAAQELLRLAERWAKAARSGTVDDEIYAEAAFRAALAQPVREGEPVGIRPMPLLSGWPQPWTYEEDGYNSGPCIKDKNGRVIAALFWPLHHPDATAMVEGQMAYLGLLWSSAVETFQALQRKTAALKATPQMGDVERARALVADCVKRYGAVAFRDFDCDLVPLLETGIATLCAQIRAKEQEAILDVAERMKPAGGRQWTDEQHACFSLLTDFIAAIREGKHHG